MDFFNNGPLTTADLLISLSHALDVTAGQQSGHALRSAAIGMRIAHELEIDKDRLEGLYYALLLKDAGASSTATRMCQLFGNNELTAKRAYRLTDWTNSMEAARFVATYVRPDESFIIRARKVIRTAADPSAITIGLARDRAIGGEVAIRDIGFSEWVAECLRTIEERWDGSGGPDGISTYSIPLVSRIASVAQTLETFHSALDTDSAFEIIRARSGKWFDPEIVSAAESFAGDTRFWQMLAKWPRIALQKYARNICSEAAGDDKIDAICKVYGRISDAKTPYTRFHSLRVSDTAVEIGRALDMGGDRLRTLRRAGLLHDIGKLAVPNMILDKPQKLTDDEWIRVKKYPFRTEQILTPIKGFRRLAQVACAHNERLDGRGYHRGVGAVNIDLDQRIIAVADVYDALTADRPQRQALPLEKVFRIMDQDAGVGLDLRCVTVLKEKYRRGAIAPTGPAPLRELKAA